MGAGLPSDKSQSNGLDLHHSSSRAAAVDRAASRAARSELLL